MCVTFAVILPFYIYRLFAMKLTICLLTILSSAVACSNEKSTPSDSKPPSNLVVNTSISQDGSGKVSFTAQADGAVRYHYFFEKGSRTPKVSLDGKAETQYSQSGIRTYQVRVLAYGANGLFTEKTLEIRVEVIRSFDKELAYLTGGSRKEWQWRRSEKCHFGVGPPDKTTPDWFCAQSSSSYPCLYDDVLVFGKDFTFELQAGKDGTTFINWAEVTKLFADASPKQFVDECRATDKIKKTTLFTIYQKEGKTYLSVPNSTLSYWANIPEYEILSLTDSTLSVRGIQTKDDGEKLMWYYSFETGSGFPSDVNMNCQETLPKSSCPSSGSTGKTPSGNRDVLVWSDEFDTDGAPCSQNWIYDIGVGSNGWGNNESQYYTYRPKNVVVENGILKITALRETYCNSSYSSARLKTQGLFDFKYGRVVVRAKLPSGKGTWPAIWMLGSNITSVGWPACGEIDIMEHVGNRQNTVHSTLHYPNHSGANGVGKSKVVDTASSEFHSYEVQWSESSLKFSIDGEEYHTIPNNSRIPFNHKFFIILNVAMGGNFGGAIDPTFRNSAMEIDYVRVYQ